MRISNVEWLKKRIGFIRKLGRKQHGNGRLSTCWMMRLRSVRLTGDCSTFWQPLKKRVAGTGCRAEKGGSGTDFRSENRRERNHKLFLAAGLMIDAGLVDTKTGELNFDSENY